MLQAIMWVYEVEDRPAALTQLIGTFGLMYMWLHFLTNCQPASTYSRSFRLSRTLLGLHVEKNTQLPYFLLLLIQYFMNPSVHTSQQ